MAWSFMATDATGVATGTVHSTESLPSLRPSTTTAVTN